MRSDAEGNIDACWSVVTLVATMTWTLDAMPWKKVHETPRGTYYTPGPRDIDGTLAKYLSREHAIDTNKNVEQNGNDANRYTVILPHYNLQW